MLKPDDTYETDKAPDAKHKSQYRWVCGKCYRRVNDEATDLLVVPSVDPCRPTPAWTVAPPTNFS